MKKNRIWCKELEFDWEENVKCLTRTYILETQTLAVNKNRIWCQKTEFGAHNKIVCAPLTSQDNP